MELEYDYENIDVMQCVECGQVQYATVDRCSSCGGELKLADKEVEEALREEDRNLLERAMQIKAQKVLDDLHQGKFNYRQENQNTPKCPTCGSTDIKKISTTSKVAGAITFGLLSKTAKSQFKCNNCGYKW